MTTFDQITFILIGSIILLLALPVAPLLILIRLLTLLIPKIKS
jgi:hypothetical protein